VTPAGFYPACPERNRGECSEGSAFTDPSLRDYHTHSSCGSCDAHATIPQLCSRAAELDLVELVISDHVDYTPGDLGFGFYDYQRFSTEFESARQATDSKLVLLCGAEIGEPQRFPAEVRALIADDRFDLVMGSLHWVHDEFVDEAYFQRHGPSVSYRHYFDELLLLAENAEMDVLAHLDLAKRYAWSICGPFDPDPFWPTIEQILRVIIQRGIALEVNASGYRQDPGEPYPGEAVIRRYRELGGELVTIGSDAHRVEQVGAGLEQAAALLRRTGFTTITTYRNRQPRAVAL